MSLNVKIIPKGWRKGQFVDCIDLSSLKKIKGLKKSEYKSDGKYLILDQGQDFISGYTDDEKFVNKKYPAILFGDHTRIIKFIDFPFVAGADGTKIFQSKKEVNPKFLYYSLINLDIPNTGYNRHFKLVKESKILLPPFLEQNKIAEILSSVDEEIEKVGQEIKKTEEFKRGLMAELLTKGIGHKKFKKTKLGMMPEDWEVVKLQNSGVDLIDGDRGANYPKQDEFYATEYCLFLSNKNIKNDRFVFEECMFITKEKDGLLRKGKFQRNDIVLTTRGTVGNVAYYNDSVPYENIRINSGMLILRHGKKLDSLFLYKLLSSQIMKQKYKDMGSGSAQPQLPIGSINNINIPLIPLDEQKKIAKIISDIDSKIDVNKQIKNKLAELKRGLLQDLLSGKRRINMNANIKNELAKRAIIRAQSGLYFLLDVVLPHIQGSTDAAYSRSAYILLSFNTELVLSAFFILGSKKTLEQDIIKDLIVASKLHNLESLFSKIPKKFRFDIQNITKKKVGEFEQYDIKISNAVITIEDFTDVRYDFKKSALRSLDQNEGQMLKNATTILVNLCTKMISNYISFSTTKHP